MSLALRRLLLLGILSPFLTPVLSAQTITVTTAADAVPPLPGSLRQAILDANSCQCRIIFHIDPAEISPGGVFIIRPVEPLPEAAGFFISIDATTQTAFSGDTNPSGPEVVIDGSLLSGQDAHGLVMSSGFGSIYGFQIQGFAGSAASSGVLIHDLRGEASPSINASVLRYNSHGVTVDHSASATVRDNLISDNVVDGIRVRASTATPISFNTIERNGQGIVVENSTTTTLGGNTIRENTGTGVIIGVNAEDTTLYTRLGLNLIYSNGGLGIDIGNDGVTLNDPGDSDQGPNSFQNFPSIDLVAFNGSGTTVTGSLDSTPGDRFIIDIFSSDVPDPSGYGEAQTYEGSLSTMTDGSGHTFFEFHRGGAPGPRWFSATATWSFPDGAMSPISTSELGKAVHDRPPVAENDLVTGGSDIIVDVLQNDFDPENEQVVVQSVGSAAHGLISCQGNGICHYVAMPGFVGSDVFTYVAADANGGTSSAEVTVNVTASNRAPVAADDVVTTSAGHSVSLNVMANDRDPDGETLRLISSSGALHGVATCTTAGACTYTSTPNFLGVDSFEYTIADAHGAESSAIVRVVVARGRSHGVRR